jgi:hypothetical protein
MNGSGLMQRMLGGQMMELDVRVSSKAFIETLRSWLTDLESLEATGAATPDSCEMLVELHELLDKLYTMMLERARQTLQ